MHIVHNFRGYKVQKEGDSDRFLLTNKIGGYSSFEEKNISKHQGVFFSDHFELFKVIENILFSGKVTKMINQFHLVEKIRGDIKHEIKEEYFMPHEKDALVVTLTKPQDMQIILDCRKSIDFSEWGREYSIKTQGNKIIVHYEKRSSTKENASTSEDINRKDVGRLKEDENRKEGLRSGKLQYEIYLVIIPDSFVFDKTDEWKKVDYSYDERRKSISSRYVYDAFTIRNISSAVFAYGTSLSEVLKTADDVSHNFTLYKKQQEKLDFHMKFTFKKEAHTAFLCAQHSLNHLIQKIDDKTGIYAGLYWFHQFWTRDTLFSLTALLSTKQYSLIKKILFTYLDKIDEHGKLLNRFPAAELGCADGTGLLFKRFDDFFSHLEKKKIRKQYISDDELRYLKAKLENVCFTLLKESDKGLILNKTNETWMDASKKEMYDGRDGARIEIQALQLHMYAFLRKLSKYSNDKNSEMVAKRLEDELLFRVREHFWMGTYIKDGSDDPTIRPNIFIAYYVYPNLLTAGEWITCFNYVLPKLWTGFGVSSIDKTSPLFIGTHSGEDDKSYHRGDSWYFLNNLTAIVLADLSKFRYRKYIDAIFSASVQDILWQGIPGHHSQISSANTQEAFGCFAQAWSNALFIELCEVLL